MGHIFSAVGGARGGVVIEALIEGHETVGVVVTLDCKVTHLSKDGTELMAIVNTLSANRWFMLCVFYGRAGAIHELPLLG